jgi:hypothetical protein
MGLKRFSKRTWFALWIFFFALVTVIATYAYMLNKHPSAELSTKDASNGLILEIDKAVYKRGENVTITLTNDGTETVQLPSPVPFVIRDLQGNAVAPGAVIGRIEYLHSGARTTWVWDQYDHRSSPHHLVHPSIYTVELYLKIADLSVKFEIV